MKHILLTIQYDGANYHGWQRQPNAPTVQGVIEEALTTITGRPTVLTGAGRTDAGVHALGQNASFFTDSRLTPDIFKRALNAMLAREIRIVDAELVAADFHCRFSAKRKRYFYVIFNDSNNLYGLPFIYRYVWELRHALNTEAMRQASQALFGRHDFKSFCAADTDVDTTVREIYSLEVETLSSIEFLGANVKGRFIRIIIEADGFLRHMVRNITGTLVDVGLGKSRPDDIETILKARDRKKAGMTAPGQGLFLDKVYY